MNESRKTNNSVRNEEIVIEDGQYRQQSKAGIGVVMGLFLGIFGFVIGLFMFDHNSYEWRTFNKAFWITYIITSILSLVLFGLFYRRILLIF